MANEQQDPAELIKTGIKFFGEAAKMFGREAKEEGRQMRDAWSDVTDKIKPAEPAAKATVPPSLRDELLFGLASRGVEALESIAESLKSEPAPPLKFPGGPWITNSGETDPRLRG